MNISNATETSVEDLENDELAMLLLAAREDEKDAVPPVKPPLPNGVEVNLTPARPSVPSLREDPSFEKSFNTEGSNFKENVPSPKPKKKVAEDEIDSSDDEEVKNFLERKYNEYGSDINKKLKQQNIEKKEEKVSNEIDRFIKLGLGVKGTSAPSPNGFNRTAHKQTNSTSFLTKKPQLEVQRSPLPTPTSNSSVYSDPIFGLRLVNPLISSTILMDRMTGKTPVAISSVQFHIQRADLTKDWVIAGAIVNKSPVKNTKKGQPFSIWKLTDLKGDIKMISLFLFKGAHKDLWKTNTGMIVAVLNPSVFDKGEDRKDEAAISIDTSQKVMILGQSKDLGVCKARKKNGEPCTSIVNLHSCEFCVYHVKQEFDRMSKRSDLQSTTAGRGLNDLRNKILGKNELFYGGQSFVAVPAKKNAKLAAKDQDRLQSLSEYSHNPNAGSINHTSKPKTLGPVPYAQQMKRDQTKQAASMDCNRSERIKDMERLRMLNGCGESANLNTSERVASPVDTPVPDKFKNTQFSFSNAPKLSQDAFSFDVVVNKNSADMKKLKALEIIKKTPIEKSDPNFVKYRGTNAGKKRLIQELEDSNEPKKQKLEAEVKEKDRRSRLQRIIDAQSSHLNLIRSRENEEQEKYFSKLEKKEALQEKLLSTYKVPCKAVICQKCKYSAFSAADRCKEEKHPLKVVDAEKRFFECSDCGNRTVSLHKIPKFTCNNCHSSRWKRAAMIKDKKVDASAGLSIRGDEEKFLGSLNAGVSMNLLVPDE